jgi:hypothetical protein
MGGAIIGAALAVIATVLGLGGAWFVIRRLRGWNPRWSVRASQEMELRLTDHEAARRIMTALSRLPLSGEISHGPDGNSFQATVSGPWLTYGSIVNIDTRPLGKHRVTVIISGRPATPALFDRGRSRAIVQRLAAELSSRRD